MSASSATLTRTAFRGSSSQPQAQSSVTATTQHLTFTNDETHAKHHKQQYKIMSRWIGRYKYISILFVVPYTIQPLFYARDMLLYDFGVALHSALYFLSRAGAWGPTEKPLSPA